MGVYIKNMEMPTSCISCLLNFGEKRPEYGLTIYCPYSDGVISWRDKAFDNGRLASCGIVPVPPHGRLIEEADAIETAWMILRGLGYLKEENPQLDKMAREVFATAPTIEVE